MDKLYFCKKGFTLAEVLITIGIIGVVAAMTIPNLMTKIQKSRLETQLKVTYSVIQQAMKSAEGDGADFQTAFVDNFTANKKWFDEYILPNLKFENVCYNQPGCWHKPGEVKNLLGQIPPYETVNGIGLNIITFTTAKGAWFDMDGFRKNDCDSMFGITTPTGCLVIYFDVNGSVKPNRIGKDIYILVQSEKGLIPAGSEKSKEQIEKNCNTGNGYWCLAKVKNDSWSISEKVLKR